MSEQPLAEYKRVGFSLAVHANRIETTQATFMWLRNRQVILLRNVANVENRVNRIVVHTNDGKKHSFVCGTQTGRIYDAIMQAL